MDSQEVKALVVKGVIAGVGIFGTAVLAAAAQHGTKRVISFFPDKDVNRSFDLQERTVDQNQQKMDDTKAYRTAKVGVEREYRRGLIADKNSRTDLEWAKFNHLKGGKS